uniref:Uncharacterized protein n=1 Tax=Triticum urartu TaxID=4572 RepID=A0A8R7PBL9_TRIUA
MLESKMQLFSMQPREPGLRRQAGRGRAYTPRPLFLFHHMSSMPVDWAKNKRLHDLLQRCVV